VKLLRVLQERKFERLGENRTLAVDVRIIAATNADLERLVEQGRFREDLFYRLNVIPLFLPPLRDRREDIIPLTEHFLDRFNKEHGKGVSFTPEAIDLLREYRWPGNVRELENLVERTVVMAKASTAGVQDLPRAVRLFALSSIPEEHRPLQGPAGSAEPSEFRSPYSSRAEHLRAMEKEELRKALESTGWVIARAAKILRTGTFLRTLFSPRLLRAVPLLVPRRGDIPISSCTLRSVPAQQECHAERGNSGERNRQRAGERSQAQLSGIPRCASGPRKRARTAGFPLMLRRRFRRRNTFAYVLNATFLSATVNTAVPPHPHFRPANCVSRLPHHPGIPGRGTRCRPVVAVDPAHPTIGIPGSERKKEEGNEKRNVQRKNGRNRKTGHGDAARGARARHLFGSIRGGE
jgi:hypothetical protein